MANFPRSASKAPLCVPGKCVSGSDCIVGTVPICTERAEVTKKTTMIVFNANCNHPVRLFSTRKLILVTVEYASLMNGHVRPAAPFLVRLLA